MKIKEETKLNPEVFNQIKKGLRKSRQLTSQTLNNIQGYARKWLFFEDSEGNMLGHAAIKKSEREEFDTEIGFIYTYPSQEYSREEIITSLVEYINNNYGSGGIYAEVLLNPIKRVFRNLGYSKIDEWDSKVRSGNKVELYTNKDLIIISEDNMKKKNLWNFLENQLKKIDEANFDIVEEGGQITFYKGYYKDGNKIASIPKKGNVIDGRVPIHALTPFFNSLKEKFRIPDETIENFKKKYTGGVPIFQDVIELDVTQDVIEIRPEAKEKAARQ